MNLSSEAASMAAASTSARATSIASADASASLSSPAAAAPVTVHPSPSAPATISAMPFGLSRSGNSASNRMRQRLRDDELVEHVGQGAEVGELGGARRVARRAG